MEKKNKQRRKCCGFPGPCNNDAGHPDLPGIPANPDYCEECDRKRHLSLVVYAEKLYVRFSEGKTK